MKLRTVLFSIATAIGVMRLQGQIVIDGGGEDWAVVEGSGDLAGPESSVDLLEMKAAVTAVDSDGDVLLLLLLLLLLGNFGKPSS